MLVAAAVAAFGWSLVGSFHFDDYSIFSDPALTSRNGWAQIWGFLQTRPLTNLTFWLNYQIGGRNPVGYHAVNLALHIACVLLLLSALRRLIPERAAWIAAALFAVHPIVSEPVNYVFARGTLLATMFCVLALRDWTRQQHWAAVAWFAAALLSKEECVAFPVFLLLLHIAISRNRREWGPIAAMLALSGAGGLRVMIATARLAGSGAGVQAGIARGDYLAAQGGVILRYLRLLIVPWGFTVDPQISLRIGWVAWLAWAGVIVLAAFALRWFDRARAGFWFVAGLVLLLPSSSIFPANDLAADRRMYLPMIAFAACAGFLLRKTPNWALGIVACGLIALSVTRCEVWKSERSLWTEAVERAPDKVRPKIQLARVSSSADALGLLKEAENIAPDSPEVASEEGKVYLMSGNPAAALTAFGRALALAPRDPAAFNNRGAALLGLGQREAALQDFERALALDPCQFDARLNMKRLAVEPPRASCKFTPEQKRVLRGQ